MHDPISLPKTLQTITQPWQPVLIASVNDHEVKLARFAGAFPWHAHPDTDELFHVLGGRVTLEVEGAEPVRLEAGGVFVVPRGVRHRPVAGDEGAEVLMVEKRGTVNTGDLVGSERTVVPEDRRVVRGA